MSSFLNRRRRHCQTAHEHGEPPSHRCAGQLIGSYGLVPSVQARERAPNVLFFHQLPCVFRALIPTGIAIFQWVTTVGIVGTVDREEDRRRNQFTCNRRPNRNAFWTELWPRSGPLKERACVLLRISFSFRWIKAERREDQPLDPGLAGKGVATGPRYFDGRGTSTATTQEEWRKTVVAFRTRKRFKWWNVEEFRGDGQAGTWSEPGGRGGVPSVLRSSGCWIIKWYQKFIIKFCTDLATWSSDSGSRSSETNGRALPLAESILCRGRGSKPRG